MELKIISGQALVKAIAKVAADAASLTQRLHVIACSVCVEAINTGNLTHLNDFDAAVEHIGRRAIRRWLAKHGPVKWDSKAKSFVFADKKRDAATKLGTEKYGDDLLSGPTYTDEAKDSDTDPFKAIDLPKLIRALDSRVADAEESGDTRHNLDGAAELYALAGKIGNKAKPKAEPKLVKVSTSTAVETASTIQ